MNFYARERKMALYNFAKKGTQIMNARQISELIPNIIATRATSPSDHWLLIIHEGKIACIASEDLPCDGAPLLPITMKHIDKGLSGREWDRVTNRIAEYQKTHPDFYAEPAQITEPEKKTRKRSKKKTKDEAETTPDAE